LVVVVWGVGLYVAYIWKAEMGLEVL
jgi:hypothetical protein